MSSIQSYQTETLPLDRITQKRRQLLNQTDEAHQLQEFLVRKWWEKCIEFISHVLSKKPVPEFQKGYQRSCSMHVLNDL